MWECVVSIDKRQSKLYHAVCKSLKSCTYFEVKKKLAGARCYFELSAQESCKDKAKELLYQIISDIVLCNYKHEFTMRRLETDKSDYCTVAVIAIILFFDNDSESDVLISKIAQYKDYCIDGICNFAIKDLKEDWSNLCDITNALLCCGYTADELLEICKSVLEEKENDTKLLVADIENCMITDLTDGKIVEIDNLYDDSEFNILSCILSKFAKEVVFDDSFKDSAIAEVVKKITNVKYI